MRWFLLLAVSICLSWTIDKKTVSLEVELTGCADQKEIYLYEFIGIGFQKIGTTTLEDGKAVFEVEKGTPRFYYVGTAENNARPIILGTESGVQLAGNCTSLRETQIKGSDLNSQYDALKAEVSANKSKSNTLSQQFSQLRLDPEAQGKIVEQMTILDKQKMDLLDSIRTTNSYLANVVELNTYLSYPVNPEGYANEIVYFAEQFFQFVDWTDAGLDYNPWVYESWKGYVETLSRIGIQAEQHKAYVEASLAKIPSERRSYQLALGGAIASLEKTQHPNYSHFTQLFVDKYQEEYPEVCKKLQQKIKRMGGLSVGGEAPDFEQATPEGEMLNLHSLRGKVVLIDFWASWCGPCRRENPNVVRVYESYKDKGFEVLGVSLDKDRNRWLKAIEADGLTWPHVSDLKGWSNEAAQLYGVRSIPATVLLDEEGKIIARNLRGPALENKLKEVLGE